MKKINNFTIDTADMPNAAVTRNFVINGELGAVFTLVVLQADTQMYYNFTSGEFEAGHSSSSNLIVTLTQKKYRNNIKFPVGAGSYVIKLIPAEGTFVQFGVLSKTITKLGTNATITFTPGTTNAVNYATFPTTTSTGGVDTISKFEFDWDVTNWNGAADAGSYGLRITNETTVGLPSILESYWYFTTTEAVVSNPAGDGEDGITVTVADTTDLAEGTELYYHKGTTVPTNKAGSAVGKTTITKVDPTTNIVTFSQAVGFEDSETMTFRAYGSKAIYHATGVELQFPYTVVEPTILTHTVRANVSGSTSITLNDTLGLSGGSIAKYRGVGVNNESSNLVVSIATPDPNGVAGDGAVTVELAQTLTAGTVLEFAYTYKTVTLVGTVEVNKYPTSDRTIHFDIDKILTVGTQS